MYSKTLRTIWIFRHGLRADWLTDFDPAMVHDKDNDIAPAGIQQFEYCADYLKQEPVHHIISSPYIRCVHSAEIIARKLNLPVHIEKGLHESHGGEVPSICTTMKLKSLFPHVDEKSTSLFDFACHESEEQSHKRGGRVLLKLIDHWPGNLCIISHGNPIVGMRQALVPRFPKSGMRCAHVSRFDLTPQGWVATIPYSIDHLGPVDVSTMRHIDWDPQKEQERLASWRSALQQK